MGHIDDLYRRVWLEPDDEHLRAVLADALLAAGDPRGELIQAQLHPDLDHERRAMRLIQQYGLTWLGELRGAVLPLSYERGFLASCLVVDVAGAGVLDCEEWATVHTCELPEDLPEGVPGDVPEGIEALALRPAMRSLRRLVNVPPALLPRLARETPDRLGAITVEAPLTADLLRTLRGRELHRIALRLAVSRAHGELATQLEELAAARPWWTVTLP